MTRPLRILNLFTILNRGGAETMVMNYYRALDKTQVQFDFMVHREERGAYEDEIEAMGGRIYRMCPIYPQNIGRYQQLLKTFFDEHPEYQILHSHMSELGYFAFKEAARHHVPVRICHAHNIPVFRNETFTEKLKRLPREILARLITPLSTDYFACSKGAGEWLFGKQKQAVILNNAIDTAQFVYNPELSAAVRAQYGWTGKLVVGHVGRFCPQKNHLFLLDIFFHIQQEVPESVLVLVGDGELRTEIVRKIAALHLEQKVVLMGSVSEVHRLYQAFDLFLFPSLYEGFGNVLLEAQAAGLPSFTTKDTVPQQACISPLLHYLPLSDSAEQWKDAVLQYRNHPRENMYQAVLDHHFDIAQNASWLAAYYQNSLP